MNYTGGNQQTSLQYQYNHSIPNCHSKLSSTGPAFESIERFIGGCHSLVRVLESTLAATHSGFNVLCQLTHQYSTIKRSLGNILGLVSMLRWLKNKYIKASATLSVQEFDSFCQRKSQRFNKTPLVLFIILTSIPAIISCYAANQQPKQEAPAQAAKKYTPNHKQLDFARALYPFKAESAAELNLEPNDLIAILSKESNDWWRGRLKNGKTGYFPANHVEIIEKKAILEVPILKKDIAPSA